MLQDFSEIGANRKPQLNRAELGRLHQIDAPEAIARQKLSVRSWPKAVVEFSNYPP